MHKLMARRRKKSKAAVDLQKAAGNNGQSPLGINKSLPELPLGVAAEPTPSAETETPPLEMHMGEHIEPASRPRYYGSRGSSSRNVRRDVSPAAPAANGDLRRDNLTLPATTYKSNHRQSVVSQTSEVSGSGEEFFIPLALDTTPAPGPSPLMKSQKYEDVPSEPERMRPKIAEVNGSARDYFTTRKGSTASRQGSREKKPMVPDLTTRDQDNNQVSSNVGTPHIAYQEKGRKPSSELTDTIRKRGEPLAPIDSPDGNVAKPPNGSSIVYTQNANFHSQSEDSRSTSTQNEMFRLQEVPKKGRKSGSSARSSRSEASSPLLNASSTANATRSISESMETPTQSQTKEQTIVIPSTGSPKPFQPTAKTDDSAGKHQAPWEDVDTSPDSARSAPSVMPSQLLHKPKREDSLGASQGKKTVPRKEVPSANQSKGSASSQRNTAGAEDISSGSSATTTQNSPVTQSQINGGKILLGGPVTSPTPMDSHEIPVPPIRAPGRRIHSTTSSKDSFTTPRAPPQPPINTPKSPDLVVHPISMQYSPSGDPKPSAKLPIYNAGGEFSMDEDMARILGGEESANSASFLRRVSPSLNRHGRSHSDNGTRMSNPQRWPKSPLNGSMSIAYPQDVSSPTTASPDTKEENIWLRSQMRRMELKTAEQENVIADLKARLDGTANIKQVNTELSEKRSTMVVLDAQKEIVIRELEVLTDRIAAAQNSNEPFDVDKMMSEMLRDFAVALQKLKESLSSQIEDLIQKRNRLIDEISNLTQMKEKDQEEAETLRVKNSQLGELNNELVVQIKEYYDNRPQAGPGVTNFDGMRLPSNGLGLYSGHQDHRSDGSSWDSRDTRVNDGSIFGPQAQVQHDYEAEPATVLTAPQVVEIRKGPKKTIWKGGHTLIKGVKGAFSSNTQSQYREGQLQDSVPHGQLASEQGRSIGRPFHDASRPQGGQGPFGLFGGAQKPPPRAAHLKGQSNGSMSNIVAANASHLFGSELESRAEYEKRPIPSIVTRCIEEVELRGMDTEGIYRKSGGAGQVKIIHEGFEASDDYDISDPDLDINAVTSALKQYLRKLPTPLVTYEVYDRILESNDILDAQQRVSALSYAIQQLPLHHRDCFNFLIFHLARVAEREKENLMTPLNLAVVFAPTIMRPLSIEREMSDMNMKNQAIQFLIENNEAIFAGPQPGI
ncbi:MAG: hypothetical protein M1812_004037 [Candelaria pacifica]|nr:MAG: hypothetical protein M1812_004037 [Candelaria pacifica]